MEDDLKLQDFDQWFKIFILKHEGENLSKEFKILGTLLLSVVIIIISNKMWLLANWSLETQMFQISQFSNDCAKQYFSVVNVNTKNDVE